MIREVPRLLAAPNAPHQRTAMERLEALEREVAEMRAERMWIRRELAAWIGNVQRLHEGLQSTATTVNQLLDHMIAQQKSLPGEDEPKHRRRRARITRRAH